MTYIDDISRRLVRVFNSKADRFAATSIVVKVVMVVLASGVMGVSQFAEITNKNGDFAWWNVAGIVAAVLVLVGGIILLVIEGDTSVELALAQEATQEARLLMEEVQDSQSFDSLLIQSLALSSAYSAMRAAIEQSVGELGLSAEAKIQNMLEACHRQLEAAADLQPGVDWTLCIYRARQGRSGVELHLVSDKRASPCDRNQARSWPSGVGPAGLAYAQGAEVVLSDLASPHLGTTFRIPKPLSRDHDQLRFRSFMAVPVLVGEQHHKWGVVVATLNAPGHFPARRFDPDTISTDTIRAVAEMVALLVSINGAELEPQAGQRASVDEAGGENG